MRERPVADAGAGGTAASASGVTAVVLTHMRPGLAGDVARSLLDIEGFPPEQVVVVVNGAGGLDDPALEAEVRTVRLPVNTGPAGGFRAGLLEACADPGTRWVYLCEDDVGLFGLPAPARRRTCRAHRGTRRPLPARRCGRRLRAAVRRTRDAHGECRPGARAAHDLSPVDVACWGATLVSRSVVDAGVLPDPEWFFGLEDFDFFCRVREAGFDVRVDGVAARKVAHQQSDAGREAALGERRPTDGSEPWRRYYHARNSFALVRRHGRPSWYAWQAAYSIRHLQLARGRQERSAILHGLWDGIRGRLGENPRYARSVGEFPSAVAPRDPEPGAR